MQLFGFLFLALLISLGITLLDNVLPGIFLNNFLQSGFLETFAALAGFNIAAVIFIVGQLMELESRVGDGTTFVDTRKEIEHNAFYILSAFLADFLLLVFRPDWIPRAPFVTNLPYYTCNILIIALFLLAMYAIFEIVQAVFKLANSRKS